MKTCTKCGETKDEGLFYKGRQDCKACKTKVSRKYYAENPEKVCANSRKYYAENKEKASAIHKVWRAENPEKVRTKDHKWRAENPEKVRTNIVKNGLVKTTGVLIKLILTEIVQEKLEQLSLRNTVLKLDAEKLASIDDQAARDIALAVTEGKTPDKEAVKALKTVVRKKHEAIIKKLT